MLLFAGLLAGIIYDTLGENLYFKEILTLAIVLSIVLVVDFHFTSVIKFANTHPDENWPIGHMTHPRNWCRDSEEEDP